MFVAKTLMKRDHMDMRKKDINEAEEQNNDGKKKDTELLVQTSDKHQLCGTSPYAWFQCNECMHNS